MSNDTSQSELHSDGAGPLRALTLQNLIPLFNHAIHETVRSPRRLFRGVSAALDGASWGVILVGEVQWALLAANRFGTTPVVLAMVAIGGTLLVLDRPNGIDLVRLLKKIPWIPGGGSATPQSSGSPGSPPPPQPPRDRERLLFALGMFTIFAAVPVLLILLMNISTANFTRLVASVSFLASLDHVRRNPSKFPTYSDIFWFCAANVGAATALVPLFLSTRAQA